MPVENIVSPKRRPTGWSGSHAGSYCSGNSKSVVYGVWNSPAGIIVDAVEWVTALSVPSIGGRLCLPSISPPRHCRRVLLLQEAERLLVLVSLPWAVI
jgi:hypothetical protein